MVARKDTQPNFQAFGLLKLVLWPKNTAYFRQFDVLMKRMPVPWLLDEMFSGVSETGLWTPVLTCCWCASWAAVCEHWHTRALAIHVADPDWAQASWYQLGTALGVVSIWVVDDQWEIDVLYVYLPLPFLPFVLLSFSYSGLCIFK